MIVRISAMDRYVDLEFATYEDGIKHLATGWRLLWDSLHPEELQQRMDAIKAGLQAGIIRKMNEVE